MSDETKPQVDPILTPPPGISLTAFFEHIPLEVDPEEESDDEAR